jgi:hypothetical protein
MTLCLAAACINEGTQMIVLASDMKIGTWAASAEIGFKMKWARVNWPALVAGEMSRATELVRTFNGHLNGIDLDSHNVFDAMKQAGSIFREKLADEITRKNLSVSLEYLRKNKSKFPAAKVLQTYTQISEIDSGAELIVCGFTGTNHQIFVVEKDCTVTHRDNFACIGTGAYIAEPALFQRRQNLGMPLVRTLYQVYEAKRLGEIAEGVGQYTVMLAIAPLRENGTEIRFLPVGKGILEVLEQKYEEYGLKSTEGFKWPDGFDWKKAIDNWRE